MRLENKTAIVTVAGRGLGKGIALKLAAEGAKVIVADMSMETASATAEEINASSGTAKAFAVNIAKQDEVKAMMDFTVESFGTLDVIVNNAGINRDAMLHKMTVEQWDQVIAVNLTGTFYCVQYAAQIMREREAAPSSTSPPPAGWGISDRPIMPPPKPAWWASPRQHAASWQERASPAMPSAPVLSTRT